jgi:hypothetical protein
MAASAAPMAKDAKYAGAGAPAPIYEVGQEFHDSRLLIPNFTHLRSKILDIM